METNNVQTPKKCDDSPKPTPKPEGGVAVPASSTTSSEGGSAKLSPGVLPFKRGAGSGSSSSMPFTPIAALNHHSEPEMREPCIVSSTKEAEPKSDKSDKAKGNAATQQPIGTRGANLTPIQPPVFFTTDIGPGIPFQGGHYVQVKATPGDGARFDKAMTHMNTKAKIAGMNITTSNDCYGLAYTFCFDDVRDTHAFVEYIQMCGNGWQGRYITQAEYAKCAPSASSSAASKPYDGQIIVVAHFEGPTDQFKSGGAREAAHTFSTARGDVLAFQALAKTWPNLEFRTEFFKISEAKKALETACKDKDQVVGDFKLFVKEMPEHGHADRDGVQAGMASPATSSPTQGGQFVSPTGRTSWYTDENGVRQPTKPMVILPKVGPVPHGVPLLSTPHRDRFYSAPNAYPMTPPDYINGVLMAPRSMSWDNNAYYSPAPWGEWQQSGQVANPQIVEVWRIQNGTDVRTTIMLRNIPNKLNVHMLHDLLNATSHGRYDFAYLRVDFGKGTNVGYAFVNFIDPLDIIPFVEKYEGHRWMRSNGRVVQVSYATIQGYDCLVEKFRNSAIMMEFPDFIPKVFYTADTAPAKDKIGAEAPFPAANNLSKKQRSIDNANQIGLYAPKNCHGKVIRPRGRQSQYDRGTTAQIQEEAQYQMSPVQSGYHYNNGYSHHGYSHHGYDNGGYQNGGYQSGYQNGGYQTNGYQNNGYQYNGYQNNGYHGNGYNMAPRALAPPPQFPAFKGFSAGQPHWGHGPQNQQDPFAPAPYNGGHGNGHNANNNSFVVRGRNLTNGKLGGGPASVIIASSAVQSPADHYNLRPVTEAEAAGGYNNTPGPHFCPTGVLTDEDIAGGYNNTPGPHYCPKY
ncbi:hypothetical protein LTR62_008609 [Meristemomyces frigidus]|uniref:RRM domain-containing protein n=1 Tax=Meristemomyces frigidus TaxID=1508187 RepID=A0AAN7TAJ9_9PEZI|nr:hypothetical protein LTR62_008609 [Meristemomyces frigidus]